MGRMSDIDIVMQETTAAIVDSIEQGKHGDFHGTVACYPVEDHDGAATVQARRLWIAELNRREDAGLITERENDILSGVDLGVTHYGDEIIEAILTRAAQRAA